MGVRVRSIVSSSVAFRVPATQRLDQLEVAAGHLVEPEMGATAPHSGARQVRHAAGLEFGEIAQQCAGGAERRVVVLANAQSVERCECEASGQLLPRQRGVELPALARGAERAVA